MIMNESARPSITEEELSRFQQLVDELHTECARLMDTNQSLREENEALRRENEQLREQAENAAGEERFSADERQMLKQQLRMLIKRIDHHLKETA